MTMLYAMVNYWTHEDNWLKYIQGLMLIPDNIPYWLNVTVVAQSECSVFLLSRADYQVRQPYFADLIAYAI